MSQSSVTGPLQQHYPVTGAIQEGLLSVLRQIHLHGDVGSNGFLPRDPEAVRSRVQDCVILQILQIPGTDPTVVFGLLIAQLPRSYTG